MRKRIVIAVALLALAPALYWGLAWFALGYEGSPREAERQVEALGGALRQFLADHREALDGLRTAAAEVESLPDAARRQVEQAVLEQADICRVYAQDGRLLVEVDNGMYTGVIYTTARLGSGAPPLPEGAQAGAGQTFWTFDRYHRMEILDDGWYAEYWSYPRG